jgi:hypothetical protein
VSAGWKNICEWKNTVETGAAGADCAGSQRKDSLYKSLKNKHMRRLAAVLDFPAGKSPNPAGFPRSPRGRGFPASFPACISVGLTPPLFSITPLIIPPLLGQKTVSPNHTLASCYPYSPFPWKKKELTHKYQQEFEFPFSLCQQRESNPGRNDL